MPKKPTRQMEKEARLPIVAECYKRGLSGEKTRAEVMRRLDLDTYALRSVQNDIKTLHEQWKASRLENMDEAIDLEIQRIDETVAVLWEEWERSKKSYFKTAQKSKGVPKKQKAGNAGAAASIQITEKEKTETEVVSMGNVAYITEIRAQLTERRKLLGLYSPERKEVKVESYNINTLTDEQREALLAVGEQVLSNNGK